jgi:ribosomal small subunit protein bTHX
MGKGDKKSKKGKRFRHSYGRTRQRKHKTTIITKKKTEDKPKPIEQKKPIKTQPESEKPVVVIEPKIDEIKFTQPEISEIKEEVKIPEVTTATIPNIPEEKFVPVSTPPEPVKEISEGLKKEISLEEKPADEAPKKRGRPKKKKEE